MVVIETDPAGECLFTVLEYMQLLIGCPAADQTYFAGHRIKIGEQAIGDFCFQGLVRDEHQCFRVNNPKLHWLIFSLQIAKANDRFTVTGRKSEDVVLVGDRQDFTRHPVHAGELMLDRNEDLGAGHGERIHHGPLHLVITLVCQMDLSQRLVDTVWHYEKR